VAALRQAAKTKAERLLMSSKSKSSALGQADLIRSSTNCPAKPSCAKPGYIGGGEFLSASADELVSIVTTGGRKGGFVL